MCDGEVPKGGESVFATVEKTAVGQLPDHSHKLDTTSVLRRFKQTMQSLMYYRCVHKNKGKKKRECHSSVVGGKVSESPAYLLLLSLIN